MKNLSDKIMGEFRHDSPLTAQEKAYIKAQKDKEIERLKNTDFKQAINEARKYYDNAKPSQKDNAFSYLCATIVQMTKANSITN